jgi:RNA polymerase sigma-70 factor (ECF subfamily)
MNHDEACIAMFLAGDDRGFVGLVERYERPLLSFATKILDDATAAEDMVQEAFVAVATGVESLSNRWAFRTWVFRITYFKCLLQLKLRKKEKTGRLISITPKSEPVDPLSIRTVDARAADMGRLVASLNPSDRALLELRFVEGFSVTEIAEATDTLADTVKQRIYRLRMTLKDLLESNPPERGTEP